MGRKETDEILMRLSSGASGGRKIRGEERISGGFLGVWACFHVFSEGVPVLMETRHEKKRPRGIPFSSPVYLLAAKDLPLYLRLPDSILGQRSAVLHIVHQ